jgi:predicted nucleic acid-binding protein
LTDEMADGLVGNVERISRILYDVPLVYEYPRDPKDEPYINLAIAAGADYITSRDNDLLDLMHDADFTCRFPGIKVLDPVSLLREIDVEHEPGTQP